MNSRYTSQQRDHSRVNHEANTDEIIRFVRDYQGLQREPTDIGLNKKAVLPEIGQKYNHQDEIRRRSLEEDSSSVDAAYESDPDNNIDIALFEQKVAPRTSKGPWTRSKDIGLVSMERTIHHKHNTPRKLKVDRKRRLTADARHLPPITSFDLPERPVAPTPVRERPRAAGSSSPCPVTRENTRIGRPTSARPGTRHARRMDLIREYSMVQNDLPQHPASPSLQNNSEYSEHK